MLSFLFFYRFPGAAWQPFRVRVSVEDPAVITYLVYKQSNLGLPNFGFENSFHHCNNPNKYVFQSYITSRL